MKFDAAVFSGRWPFRKLGRPEIGHLLEDHEKNGIRGGVISSLESIFYNDPAEGDEDLAKKLPKGYLFAATHNPMLPYAAKEISKNEFGAAAVRLYPCYHKYKPNDPIVLEFCRAAASANLIIHIIARMDDMRFDYLYHQQVTAMEDIEALVSMIPEAKFIVSYGPELYRKAEKLLTYKNVWLDGAYMPDLIFGYRDVAPKFPAGRLLFATHYPLQLIEANAITLDRAPISDEEKNRYGRKNAAELFGLPL